MLSNVKDIPDINRTINRSNSYYTTTSVDPQQNHRIGQQHRSYSRSSLPAQSFSHHHQQQSSSSHAYEDLNNYSTNTIKRSPSYQRNAAAADNQSVISSTLSTTTTLTPPPSESGRETPLLGSNLHHYSVSSYASSASQQPQFAPRPPSRQRQHPQLHLYIGDELDKAQDHRVVRHQQELQQRSSTSTTTTHNAMDLQQKYRREQSPGQQSSQSAVDHHQEQRRQQHQQQQVIYAAPQRQQTVELISVTSEDDDQEDQQTITPTGSNRTSTGDSQGIPYHAREHAQPFTYGDIASAAAATANGDQQQGKGTGMLKMQSGLSSPSLVRKQLGTPQHKSVPVRNEFEEMLRIRREKVDSEKYSISDDTKSGGDNYKVNGAGGFGFEEKWEQRPKSPGTVTFKRTVTTTTTSPQAASNGYVSRTYEPVKRSNTMDTYNRSLSSDG